MYKMKDVLIVNKEEFDKKLNSIKEQGINYLHIVSDYDRTLTKACFDGKKTKSTFQQLRSKGFLPKEYEERSWELYDKYYPIEIDSKKSLEEKSKAMLEWWQEHMELLVEYKLNREILIEVARNSESFVRENVFDFYKLLKDFKIPLLIFSAGQGDIIEEFLRHNNAFSGNIHIISNMYKFDKDGCVKGYEGNIIHPFNKNEHSIEEYPYFEEVKDKQNVILLGDSLGDANMCDGIKHDNIIKIGFLNFNVDKDIEDYKEIYDVIILNDSSMGFVIDMINSII
jgi:cytosolic 5'-nucleotidase 3